MRTTKDGLPVINGADEIDRLIAFHASIPDLHHRLPYLRAARAKQLAMCEIHRGGLPDQRELARWTAKRPVMLLIGDDDLQASGPSGDRRRPCAGMVRLGVGIEPAPRRHGHPARSQPASDTRDCTLMRGNCSCRERAGAP